MGKSVTPCINLEKCADLVRWIFCFPVHIGRYLIVLLGNNVRGKALEKRRRGDLILGAVITVGRVTARDHTRCNSATL